MAAETYTLREFTGDLERITREERSLDIPSRWGCRTVHACPKGPRPDR